MPASLNAARPAQTGAPTPAHHLLIAALGQSLGLPELAFNEQGCARLLFDTATAVDLEHDETSACIHVYCVLGDSPAPGEGEALYRAMLQGNQPGVQMHGAALAIDAARGELLLCRSVELAGATAAGFTDLIDRFRAAAQHWQSVLAASGQLPVDGAAGG